MLKVARPRRTRAPHGVSAAGLALAAVLGGSCVPSYPPCECSEARPFPDFDQLDRSQPCVLSEDPECGYPAGGGANGDQYGYQQADTIPNFVLLDCDSQMVEFADFLGERPDTGELNRGVIVALGAGWCQPCQEEAEHFAEIAGPLRPEGVEFLHLLTQSVSGGPAVEQTCDDWESAFSLGEYPVLYDPTDQIFAAISPNFAIPVVLAVNANAQIIFRAGGQTVDFNLLDTQIDALINNPYGN